MEVRDPTDEVRALVEATWRLDLTVGAWWAALAEAGLAFPSWPDGLGGRGRPVEEDGRVHRALAACGVLGPPSGLGTTMGGPVVAAHGTAEQQQRFLPALASGAEGWCQLFSEPGAGSDLAGLTTRAVRDGDHWVITGQKVWTSGAQVADRGMLVARTDPGVPKHRGLTYFVLPMDQPGVTVRPLRQMTGEAHFNEVFLDEAVVHHRDVLGALGDGWSITLATLAHERADMGDERADLPRPEPGAGAGQLERPVGEVLAGTAERRTRDPHRYTEASALVDLARGHGRSAEPVLRDRLMQFQVLDQVSRMTAARTKAAAATGHAPGPETSIGKLAWSQRLRLARDLGVEVLGPSGTLAEPDAPHDGGVQLTTLSIPATAIAGGTDEVQRNLIGERALGLPREPRTDRAVPFDQLPRSGQ